MNTFIKGVTMPKVLENVEDKIIAEARRMMLETHEPVTVRSVASATGIAVGTFYNYFESKEYLMAVVMLRDWNESIEVLKTEVRSLDPAMGVKKVFFCIRDFTERYRHTWIEGSANTEVIRHRVARHGSLVAAIKGCIDGFNPEPGDPYLNEFLAEIIIKFASDPGCSFDDFNRMALKLLQ